ncbi:hypothetical protein J1N35_024518 [Gossypium stocksii]|uniref:Uncharacterized protein n=1 Tax=Gossypium stocksii TaxID=47602 RepID=A0A9D3V4S7_9ROSI|nr:hypothetical protein J1N35_024518 [Gossypium stocksii]
METFFMSFLVLCGILSSMVYRVELVVLVTRANNGLDSTVQGLGPFFIHKLSRLNIRSVIPSLMSTNCQEQEVNGMSVAEIFKLHGESFFRKKEPRRGCFEIREEGGKTFISLLDMKRPFKPMKEHDMEKKAYNDWLLPRQMLVGGIAVANKNDIDQHAVDTVCALNPNSSII